MEIDYAIEEMLLQSPNQVVYEARGRRGFRYAISRFIFTKPILANQGDTCSDSALQELKPIVDNLSFESPRQERKLFFR